MSADSEDHELITPPETLKQKVTYSPDGVDQETLDRAEQVVASLQDDYLVWVQEDLAHLQDFYAKAVEDEATRMEAMAQIFRVAHDIKGQGGSFNYHLMTAVGNQLCRFIEAKPQFDDADLEVVRLHIDALRLILAERMDGDGGARGGELVKGLQAVVQKNLARNA